MNAKKTRNSVLPVVLIILVVLGAAFTVNAKAPAGQLSRDTGPQGTAIAGQILHTVTTLYERHAPEPAIGGPQHADNAFLFPETVTSETWVVAGDNDQIARAVTYRRDVTGTLISETVVNDKAELVSYNARDNQLTSTRLSAPGHVSQSVLATTLSGVLASAPNATRKNSAIGNEPTVIIELGRVPAAQFAPPSGTGTTRQPGAVSLVGLNAQTVGWRSEFVAQTGQLRRNATYAIDPTNAETILRSETWDTVAVLSGAQVSATVLNPTIPTAISNQGKFPGVSVTLTAVAARPAMPFSLYVPSGWQQDTANTMVAYGPGARIDPTAVPRTFQGLEFAVQRGEAAELSNQTNTQPRSVRVREGRSEDFSAALRRSPAFWAQAEAITVSVEATTVSGWYMVSDPVTIASAPGAPTTQAPGPAYLLLPDVQGTGVLIMASGDYQKADLLALAVTLRRTA